MTSYLIFIQTCLPLKGFTFSNINKQSITIWFSCVLLNICTQENQKCSIKCYQYWSQIFVSYFFIILFLRTNPYYFPARVSVSTKSIQYYGIDFYEFLKFCTF